MSGWLLLGIICAAYIAGSATYGILEGCVRARHARREFRDGRNAKIHEAYKRLMKP